MALQWVGKIASILNHSALRNWYVCDGTEWGTAAVRRADVTCKPYRSTHRVREHHANKPDCKTFTRLESGVNISSHLRWSKKKNNRNLDELGGLGTIVQTHPTVGDSVDRHSLKRH